MKLYQSVSVFLFTAVIFGAVSQLKPASAFAQDPFLEVSPALEVNYERIREEATRLAGAPMDMPARAQILHQIYTDSNGNHAFPLVALHGALWGHRFFEVAGPIGNAISVRYFYDRKLMKEKKRMLNEFEVSFQITNRSVFIDTYTNYYFSKTFGRQPGAEKFIDPVLLRALNEVHEATRNHIPLSAERKREIFKTALYYEQELTVGPRVHAAVQNFHCPVLTFFALKPVVHFAYFPFGAAFFFHDFSNQEERIKYAIQAYDLAVHVGWKKVESSIQDYFD